MAVDEQYNNETSNPLTETFLTDFILKRALMATGAEAPTETDDTVDPPVTYKDSYGAW